MNKLRLAVAAMVAAGLAPGTWLRTPAPPANTEQALHIAALKVPGQTMGPLTLLGAWHLSSPNSRFGGYSGLVALDDGRLLAATDRGGMLIFVPPGAPGQKIEITRFARFDGMPWGLSDLEALTRDPVTGRVWASYEAANRILRVEADFSGPRMAEPPAMHSWPGDAGPEAMVRLSNGRFIVLAEHDPARFTPTSPGLLFSRDPAEGGKPQRFRFARPQGYSPTDVAQLPDGSVILLLRHFRLGLPPKFPGKIAIAEPSDIRPGHTWHVQVVGELAAPLPSDNYEAVAVQPDGHGATVWIISDDNRSPFQRTLLLKFHWTPNAKGARIDRTPLAK